MVTATVTLSLGSGMPTVMFWSPDLRTADLWTAGRLIAGGWIDNCSRRLRPAECGGGFSCRMPRLGSQ